MASDQDSWIQNALGVDVGSIVSTVESAVCSAPADDQNASTDSPASGQTNSDQNPNNEALPTNNSAQPASNGAVQSTDPTTIQAEQDAAREQSLNDSDYYKQGYEDGVNGADPKLPPTPLGPDALDGYNKGYNKGHAEWMRNTTEEPESDLAEKGVEHVVIHGVLHAVEHLLHIGGGIYTMLVAMTVGMECDSWIMHRK